MKMYYQVRPLFIFVEGRVSLQLTNYRKKLKKLKIKNRNITFKIIYILLLINKFVTTV